MLSWTEWRHYACMYLQLMTAGRVITFDEDCVRCSFINNFISNYILLQKSRWFLSLKFLEISVSYINQNIYYHHQWNIKVFNRSFHVLRMESMRRIMKQVNYILKIYKTIIVGNFKQISFSSIKRLYNKFSHEKRLMIY